MVSPSSATLKHIHAGVLDVAYEESGASDGFPVVLLHGFPDDVRTYDGTVPLLTAAGCRTIVPYLRGYGPTRFRDDATPRSGQQAALGNDLVALAEALDLDRYVAVGYDWGGRAACVASVLTPQHVAGLVSITGYNVQNIARMAAPADAEQELAMWYQWYFQTERGRAGLAANRHPICRLLWRLWSPNWAFDDATYDRTGAAFDNPDFVDVVIHSYRHRHRHPDAPGDPTLEHIEALLATSPPITVPTHVLHGGCDGVDPASRSAEHHKRFSGPYERAVVPVAGHFLPREAPEAIATATLALVRNAGG